jgi:hypothetical protein
MKAELIKKDDHYFLQVDFWYPKYIKPSIVANTFDKPEGDVYQLSKQNCDEIFEVVDVEKLAKEEAEKLHDKSNHEDWDVYNCLVYEDTEMIKIGFNKAMELNKDKQFTRDDVISAIVHHTYLLHNDGKGYDDGDANDNRIDYVIAALKQQPTEIEVEIEMRTASLVYKTDEMFPKVDENGCLILKPIR